MKARRKVLGIWKFFRSRDKVQKIINRQRLKELVSFLEGNALSPESHGVFNLAPPPIPHCPECGFKIELLPGDVSSGEGLQKDSSHYLRCRGPQSHLYTIRLLPAFPN
jgi:hypothetical protein